MSRKRNSSYAPWRVASWRAASVVNDMINAFLNMPSNDDSNSVVAYLQSRDAVTGLEAALPLRKIYAREEADAPARFPHPFFGDSFERLYWYYKDRVTVYTDPNTQYHHGFGGGFPSRRRAGDRSPIGVAGRSAGQQDERAARGQHRPRREGGGGGGREGGARRSGGRRPLSQHPNRGRPDPRTRSPSSARSPLYRPRSIR